MKGKLPSTASVARPMAGAKLHAPAAERNRNALCTLVATHAPDTGQALEIASGTGQHIVAFAHAMPGLTWHPTEIDADRIASINAYAAESRCPNLRPAQALDASSRGWAAQHPEMSLIVLINLLHLISAEAVRVILNEALAALAPDGCFALYGPFKRDGQLTSAGDARFHAQLQSADPAIGYKDDAQIKAWLRQAGARHICQIDMPANNLAFIAQP